MKYIVIVIALISLASIFYRTFYISLNPLYFRDIDFHCYKQFSEIFLKNNTGWGNEENKPLFLNDSRTWTVTNLAERNINTPYLLQNNKSHYKLIQNNEKFKYKSSNFPESYQISHIDTKQDTTLSKESLPHTFSEFRGGIRPIGIIGKLLTLFIEKPSYYIGNTFPILKEYTNHVRLILNDYFILNYEYFICDYGLMYYPAGFILIYTFVLWMIRGSSVKMQVIHAWLHFLASVGSSLLFSEYYDVPILLWMLICPWVTQTIYISGISAISNDLWYTFFSVLMLIGIKKRYYVLSSFMFTISVAYKMNALLYGPALLIVYLVDLPFLSVFIHFFSMGLVQLFLSSIFMLENFQAYVQIAYNFSRDFDHIENIKWTFLGDKIRHHSIFYTFLLGNTVLFMSLFFYYQFKRMTLIRRELTLNSKNLNVFQTNNLFDKERLFTMIGSHFIAFVFVRGLHIQFSLWIYFSLPFLLQCIFFDSNKPVLKKTIEKDNSKKKDLKDSLLSISNLKQIILIIIQFLGVVAFICLFDICLSHPRRVLHLDALVPLLKSIFLGKFNDFVKYLGRHDSSLFGKIGNFVPYPKLIQDENNMNQTYYSIIGHYYLEGFSLRVIPLSIILFSLECILLYNIFRRIKTTITKKIKND